MNSPDAYPINWISEIWDVTKKIYPYVLLGILLYTNSVSVIPIIEALVGKGVPMGTTLAFMTATTFKQLSEGKNVDADCNAA